VSKESVNFIFEMNHVEERRWRTLLHAMSDFGPHSRNDYLQELVAWSVAETRRLISLLPPEEQGNAARLWLSPAASWLRTVPDPDENLMIDVISQLLHGDVPGGVHYGNWTIPNPV
jgi:hypothetical protein